MIQKWAVFLAALLLLTSAAFDAALADHDEHKEKRWYQKIFDWDDDDDDHEKDQEYSKHYRKRYLTPANNQTYKEECGACHFAYQPELLPSGSWEKVLAGLETILERWSNLILTPKRSLLNTSKLTLQKTHLQSAP